MKLLCCDGPLNGTYQEVNRYTLSQLVMDRQSQAEIEAFANAPYDWAAEADFDFPVADLIRDAVMDAEVR